MEKAIKIGSSSNSDINIAVNELKEQIEQTNAALIILFFSARYCFKTLTCSLSKHFPDSKIIGCTTAGEIGIKGYSQHSMSAASFSSEQFAISADIYQHLSDLELKKWHDTTVKLHSQHKNKLDKNLKDHYKSFSLLLVDGMSKHEEPLTQVLANAIPGIPLAGGSAGDDLQYDKSFVLYKGQVFSNSAVLILISTDQAFEILKSQNIKASDKRMVVTHAIPEQRTITEINGLPAADEYARHLGLPNSQYLTTEILAAHPAVVVIGDSEYVRSIQQVNPDGSLVFYCAIDTGIVIRIGYSVDLISSLQNSFREIKDQLEDIQVTLTFDCILRRVELEEKGLLAPVSYMLSEQNCIGFSTYGEQINGLHVNQTCMGVAIGNHSRKTS